MLRSVIRKLLAVAGRPASNVSPAIWEGVYDDFSRVERAGRGYTGEDLISETADFTSVLAAGTEKNRLLPYHLTCEQTLLALHVASQRPRARQLRIVDFGGGMGVGYFSLRSCLDATTLIDYYVVENAAMCAKGAETFTEHRSLRFCNAFPVDIGEVDAVYVNSALQYVDDYPAVIAKLCSYNAPFLFFVRLSAGNIPSYVSAQVNLPRSRIPYRFLNLDEIVRLMRERGYALAFRGLLDRVYDQSSFAETHRLGRACNLLFTLEKPGIRA